MSSKTLRTLCRVLALTGVLALLVGPAFGQPPKKPHKPPHPPPGGPPPPKGKKPPPPPGKKPPPPHKVGPPPKGPLPPPPKLAPGEKKKRIACHKRWVKDWRAKRGVHRKARLRKLRHRLHKRYKGKKLPPKARKEFKVHAWRMARLNRAKAVATAKGNTNAVHKIDSLMARERARHNYWWNK